VSTPRHNSTPECGVSGRSRTRERLAGEPRSCERSYFDSARSHFGGERNDAVAERTHPRDECGVFAVFGHPNAAVLTYYGLFALQHRGQESAGIVTADGPGSPFVVHKDMGLVAQVFQPHDLERLKGSRAVGHVRYSTTGSSNLKNAQPLVVDCARGQLAIGHNGNLINAAVLRDELERRGSIFQTTVDSEIILHLLAQPAGTSGVLAALRRVQGAFSLVMMSEREIIGVRDPFGFRPLALGKLDGAYILSSETCALDLIHAEFIREIEPGEVVIIDEDGVRSERPFDPERRAFCMFEYVYFARPDSIISDVNVSKVRVAMGRELARLHPAEADIVVPVPDSGNYAALGFAEELGIPYSHAFVRNHYIGRTFIQPSQLIRDFNVRVKLNLIKEAVRGKRVVVVDDSIVRGTTARARVVNLREAGAQEVHMRISCPPHRHACHYGIDFPDPANLLANQCTLDQIREYLGCDSIGYLDIYGMVRATGQPKESFCLACFSGEYPVPFDAKLDKFIMERRQTRANLLAGAEEHPELFDLK
jgi:amidophosphoribosyltransferase